MKTALWIALAAAGLYGVVVVTFYLAQRALLYPAPRGYASPAALGLAHVRESPLATPDGETIMMWLQDAAPGKPTLLYFHGNGDSIANFGPLLDLWREEGWGAAVVSYRGYPGSTGNPTEEALYADARLAYDALVESGTRPQDIVLAGFSLGSAVATDLATDRPARALLLLAAIIAADDIAKRTYPFLPVRTFMRDTFRTIDRIGAVTMPVYLVHGEEDRLATLSEARRLYDAANAPKDLLVLEGIGHLLPAGAGAQEFQAFLANIPQQPRETSR